MSTMEGTIKQQRKEKGMNYRGPESSLVFNHHNNVMKDYYFHMLVRQVRKLPRVIEIRFSPQETYFYWELTQTQKELAQLQMMSNVW